jgi:hypothetical protein
MNGDGIPDIAVGSPFFYGMDGLSPLSGKVEIFTLSKNV